MAQTKKVLNFKIYAKLVRSHQWVKNLVVFAAIVFSGKLFDADLFSRSLFAFIVFCLLSSVSYIINDIFDAPSDRKHPVKKFRPIASGEVSVISAVGIAIFFATASLGASLIFQPTFFWLSIAFLLLQILYSVVLKSYAVVDIFTISFSFMVRALAGLVVTGYHIPVWLFLTIFFVSLFIAAIKRNAELSITGSDARHTLAKYNQGFLNFLIYTFSTSAIISYSMYSYIENPPSVSTPISAMVSTFFPGFEGRKLMTITIIFVVYAIARYGQLFYTRVEGERPEKLLVSDWPLMTAVGLWGIIVIALIYLF
jgi:decaprenyl-phosphate phosphoribosyltransferase